MKIHTSLALEALGLFSTYIHSYLKKEDEPLAISMDPTIHQWMKEIDGEISTFLRNDMEMLFSKTQINNWFLFFLIERKKARTTEELLDYLDAMSSDEFRSLYLKIIKLDAVPLEKITQKMIRTSVEKHFFSEVRGEDKNIAQLLKEPDEWKTRITGVYRRFHHDFFIPRQQRISEQLQATFEKSQKKLDDDPDVYLNALTVGHYKTVLHSTRDLKIFGTYCYDRGFTISIREKLFWYGFRRELLLEEIDRKAKTALLFSTLSDPKRVEILRLITQKTWYSNELAKHFKLTSATMSYHINKLLSAGLLTFEIGEQNKIYYQVNTKILCDLLDAAKEDLLSTADCSELDK